MRKQSQKSNGSRGTPDALDVSLRTAFCLLNNKKWGGPLSYLRQQFQKGGLVSATTWTHRAQQGIRKGGLPKDEPDASQRFAQHPCLPGVRISTVAPFRPAPMPTRHSHPRDARISTGTHTHLASAFRPAPIFARWSYFNRCPVSTDTMPTRCSRFARRPMFCLAFAFRPLLRFDRCPCPSGTHTHLASLIRQALMLGLMSMLTWRSCFARCPCSPDVHVSPDAHARLALVFRPTLKGDLGGTYRTRTSGANLP